jgi:hypothetical protein
MVFLSCFGVCGVVFQGELSYGILALVDFGCSLAGTVVFYGRIR